MKLQNFCTVLLLLAGLSACNTSLEPPATAGQAAGSTGNFHAKGGTGGIDTGSESFSSSSSHPLDDSEGDQALLNAAEKMTKQGDFVSATVLYRRAVGNNPKSIPALSGLAKMEEAQGRPREALEAWRNVTAIDDDNADAHRGMGRNLMTMGLYDKAITELEKAHHLGGDEDLKTVNLLAMAELRNGDKEKAIATLKEASEHTDDLSTRNNLGFAYIMSGELAKAIEVLEAVVKDPHATVQQRQNLALAYGLAGREDDARSMALQDLPPAAVANNLKTYREMRDKMLGRASPVATTPIKKKKVVKKKPKPVEPAATATPAPPPAPAPVPAASSTPAAPAPEAAPSPPPVTSAPVPAPAPNK